MKILVVLEHQSFRGVAVQGVVRGAPLEELVEPAEEIEVSFRPDEGERWPYRRHSRTRRPTDRHGDAPQPPRPGSGAERGRSGRAGPAGRQRVDVLADRLISTLDLLTNRGHERSTSHSQGGSTPHLVVSAWVPGATPPDVSPVAAQSVEARLLLEVHAERSSARRQVNDKPTFIHRGKARSKPLPLLLQFSHPSRHSPSRPTAGVRHQRAHRTCRSALRPRWQRLSFWRCVLQRLNDRGMPTRVRSAAFETTHRGHLRRPGRRMFGALAAPRMTARRRIGLRFAGRS